MREVRREERVFAGQRVQPAAEERVAPPMPASEEAAVESALQSSSELRRLESQIAAKGLGGRAAKAARLPHCRCAYTRPHTFSFRSHRSSRTCRRLISTGCVVRYG